MNIVELLQLRGLDTRAKIKLIRHQDKRYDVHDLYRTGQIETYQSYQGKPIFECDYIVCFIGMDGSRALFFGVYRVLGGCRPAPDVPIPADFPYPQMVQENDVFYQLAPLPGFEDLKDRVVVDWGKSPLAWHQWLSEKEVIEILPHGYVMDFPGYLDFTITFEELVDIVNHPVANREWHRMLAAVAGVYLIVDAKTGAQYVGSAYGQDGILGRWRQYAKTRHGGNEQLRRLTSAVPDYARHFRFCLLHTLPRTLTKNEVIRYEVLYKKKLGSRAFGLNSN